MSEGLLNQRVSEGTLNKFVVSSLDCCDFPSSTCQQNGFSSPMFRVSCVVSLIGNKMLKGSLFLYFTWYEETVLQK